MTVELTLKQEQFCQSYIETGNASEAYRRAYNAENMKPETINVKASELLSSGKIAVRVDYLQEQHRKRHDVTVDSLTVELDDAITLAKKTKNPSAVVSAIGLKSKLHGLLIEKRQLETIGRTGDVNKLSDDELTTIIRENMAKKARKSKENKNQPKDDAVTSLRAVSN